MAVAITAAIMAPITMTATIIRRLGAIQTIIANTRCGTSRSFTAASGMADRFIIEHIAAQIGTGCRADGGATTGAVRARA